MNRADFISLLRVPAAAGFACAAPLATGDSVAGGLLAAAYVLAVASDLLDGVLARQMGITTERGRWLDHGTDILFLLVAFATLAWLGDIPWTVPLAIAAAFADYATHAARGAPTGQISRIIGHAGGVANYVVLGVLASDRILPTPLLGDVVRGAITVTVVSYSVAAIVARRIELRGRSG